MKLPALSVRLRLTLIFALALSAILVLLAAGSYLVVRVELERQVGGRLEVRAAGLVNVIQDNRSSSSMWHEIDDLADKQLLPYFHVSRNGEPFYVSRDWRRAGLDTVLTASTGDSLESWTTSEGRRYLLHTVTDIHNRTRNSFDVAVAEEGEPILTLLRSLWILLLGALGLGLLLSLGGGWLLAGRVLSPVKDMAVVAEEITARSLSERLPVDNPSDEFGQLARIFNQVLDRLEASFRQLRHFTSDVSHALRTPLTVLRTTGEVRLQEGGEVAAYREAVGSMLEETDRLRELVDNLLALARAESGVEQRLMQEFGLAGLAAEVAESLAVLAEEKEQELTVVTDADPMVTADRGMIHHAVINLLDNAIRHTPDGTRIRVVTRRSESGEAVLEVSDDGPGIPAAGQDRIFERFQQLEGEAPPGAGAGLGLAIARWVVHLNNGRIEVESTPGEGSTFRIVLP